MNEKKNLMLLAGVLIGILASLLVLNFQKIGKNQKAEILEAENNYLPIKISKGTVNSFGIRSDSNKVVFYEKADSIVYESTPDGRNKKELARIPGASEVLFSPNGKEVIATIKDPDGSGKSYFNLEDNRRVKLDKRIKSVDFSPDGKNIAYLFYDERAGEGNISVSKPDGSGYKNIFKTRSDDFKLLWLENDLITFYSNSGNNEILAFSIKPDGKEFQRLQDTRYLDRTDKNSEEILKNLEIEALENKLSPLKDYLIFINAKDGKLYSLKL